MPFGQSNGFSAGCALGRVHSRADVQGDSRPLAGACAERVGQYVVQRKIHPAVVPRVDDALTDFRINLLWSGIAGMPE